MLTRENRLYRITSITFIFDRGKKDIFYKITVSWSVNPQHKSIHSKIQQDKYRMSNSKMSSRYTYADATKHRSTSDRSGVREKARK